MATILVVDDDYSVLSTAKRLLHKAGFVVVAANDGKEAIDLMSANLMAVDLIVCDLDMPTSGFLVFEWAQEHNMEGKFVFHTSSCDVLDKYEVTKGVPRIQKLSPEFIRVITSLLPSL